MRKHYRVDIDALNGECNLYLMHNLRYLEIVGTRRQDEAELAAMIATLQLCSANLISLKLENIRFYKKYHMLIAALSGDQLEVLECQYCSEINVAELELTLAQFKRIKYCIIDVRSSESAEAIAEIVNRHAIEINFSLRTLDRIPSNLLKYHWSAYRVIEPTGRFY